MGFIFRLKDESLEASDNLPDPDVIAQEIVEDLGHRGTLLLTLRGTHRGKSYALSSIRVIVVPMAFVGERRRQNT
jgi:hypothetical protein